MKKIILYFALIFLAAPAWAELEAIPLQHRNAEDVLPIIRPLLDKDGVASGMNNQLILRTSARNLAEIKRLLPDIDTVPRRLKITVMQNVDKETLKRLTAISGSVSLGRDAQFAVPEDDGDGDFAAEAKQAEDGMRARIVSTRSLEDDKKTQQIQVVEGGRAMIQVGQAIPVPQQAQGGRQWGMGSPASPFPQRQIEPSPWDAQATASPQYRQANSGFYVRPLLSGDRVTLEISAQNDARTSASDESASTQTQSLITTVNGRLGEWIEVGDISRQAGSDGSTLSTRSVSDASERRNVLLKVEEMP